MTNIADVISWKFNDQPGMTTSGGEIVDFPGGTPSQAEQDAWTAEYEAHLASTEYAILRDYGPIGEQLDMIYKDQVNGTTTFKDHVSAVKAKHPKP